MKPSAEVLAKAVEESMAASPAETEMARILARDWCEQMGGWPSDSDERMAQIWAHRPMARDLMTAIKRVSKTDRTALARFVAT